MRREDGQPVEMKQREQDAERGRQADLQQRRRVTVRSPSDESVIVSVSLSVLILFTSQLHR